MTENPSGEQVSTDTPQQQNTDWEARYKGLVKKVEELTLSNRTLNEQLTAKSSELEQLRSQLVVKDAEKVSVVGERDKLLQSITQEKVALESELTDLRGLRLKIEAIQELGRPELLKIAHRIPGMTDKDALKVVLQDFAGFADDLVQQREKQILAGVTPPLSSAGNAHPNQPASEQEWETHINSLGLGTKERGKAMDDYWTWLEKKHQG